MGGFDMSNMAQGNMQFEGVTPGGTNPGGSIGSASGGTFISEDAVFSYSISCSTSGGTCVRRGLQEKKIRLVPRNRKRLVNTMFTSLFVVLSLYSNLV